MPGPEMRVFVRSGNLLSKIGCQLAVYDRNMDTHFFEDAPAHHRFIIENKGNWKRVRVFDSVVENGPAT